MRLALIGSMLFGLAGCAGHQPPTAAAPRAATGTLDPDEYAIYRRILRAEADSATQLVLARADLRVNGLDTNVARWDSELDSAFIRATQHAGRIDSLDLGLPGVHVIAEDRLPAWPMEYREQRRRWDALQRRYGRDITFIHFSRVGFNRARTRAEVQYVARSGPACDFVERRTVFGRASGEWSPISESASFC